MTEISAAGPAFAFSLVRDKLTAWSVCVQHTVGQRLCLDAVCKEHLKRPFHM